MLVKALDNPRHHLLGNAYNQVVMTNGSVRHVQSMPTDYYIFLEFIEAVGNEKMKVLPLVSMIIEAPSSPMPSFVPTSWTV